MIDCSKLSELSVLFEIGFLSDKIVNTLFKFSQGVRTNGEVLGEALTFLETVKRVKGGFPPKRIVANTLTSLEIYRFALLACSGRSEKGFINEISSLMGILKSTLDKENISKNNLNNVLVFFSKIAEETLKETGKFFGETASFKKYPDVRKTLEFEIEKILSQNRVLGRLRLEEFPSDAQEKAITLLLKTFSLLYNKLAFLLSKLNQLPHENREKLSQTIGITTRRYNYLISFIGSLTEFIEASNISHFPLGIYYTLESIIKNFQKGTPIILSLLGERKFMYLDLITVLKTVLKNVLNKREIEKLDEGYPSCILIFNIPVLEKENILLHCLVANQIGNYLVERNESFFQILESENLPKLLRLPPKKPSNFKEQELERIGIVEQALNKIKKWVITIASDLFAIHIFGPAYLFAFSKYLPAARESDVPLETRLKITAEELKELNYTKNDELKDKIEKVELYAERSLSSLEREIFNLIPKIREKVRALTIGHRYTLQIFEEEVPLLVSSLLNLIPPNEILDFENKTSRPAKLVSILNAGWLFKLTKIDNVYRMLNAKTLEEKSQVDIKINRLIQKSIELSEIHRKMSEVVE